MLVIRKRAAGLIEKILDYFDRRRAERRIAAARALIQARLAEKAKKDNR